MYLHTAMSQCAVHNKKTSLTVFSKSIGQTGVTEVNVDDDVRLAREGPVLAPN